MKTPAQLQRELEKVHYPGSLCIFTLASGEYQYFLPLFCYMAKKAYPEHTIKVAVVGMPLIPLDIIRKYATVVSVPFQKWNDREATASLRFCLEIQGFDYVLITDADIVFARETKPLVKQHMDSMAINETKCYDNYCVAGDRRRVSGVHFVTKEWWPATEKTRKAAAQALLDKDLERHHDEFMLRNIIWDSNLPDPSVLPHLWVYHGIHLGDMREKVKSGSLVPNFDRATVFVDMLKDQTALKYLEFACRAHPWLRTVGEKVSEIYGLEPKGDKVWGKGQG
jgi:hypothetical protein